MAHSHQSVPGNGWQFWIDRGGTFTDVVARSPTGETFTRKLLSENPEHYPDAALHAIDTLLRQAPGASAGSAAIDAVKMGTTVATNALLERKGEPTVLVTTAGLADVLRIGTQHRPAIFAQHIVLPEPLYRSVIEVPERLDANGHVLIALDVVATRQALQAAYDAGLRACAVVLMHAHVNGEHEAQVGALARHIGFTQVSLSSQVSPLMKIVPRGDTTVVDAYLSPILRRYVDGMTRALSGTRLYFMQSNGGLAQADCFHGKDSILSGPAGGMVGASGMAQEAGLERVITFDMGGTSTDVALYRGELPRLHDAVVAGVRVRVPMMDIHTVAAGGGSVLHFSQGRLQVGPGSAGATPGPRAYRRGGPLTITDANVMVGKLQPQFFPSVFGPRGDAPLDAAAVRVAFTEMAAQICAKTGDRRTPEEFADGFLRIAVENIARAIKHISIARGHDVTTYALCTFGGAGGQHACRVADALGMTCVFVPRDAGVLSAYGMGLADLRVIHERTVEALLEPALEPQLAAIVDALITTGRAALSRQGVASACQRIERRVHLRYDGSDTTLVIPYHPDGPAYTVRTLQTAFITQHRERYGFTLPERRVVVAAAEVEVMGQAPAAPAAARPPRHRAGPLQPLDRIHLFTEGRHWDAPVFDRDGMLPGDTVAGPAMIRESSATTVVEPGWSAAMDGHGHLLLTRRQPRPRERAVGTHADPVMLEVFNNLFMAIAEHMGVTLANTAQSVNIKERLDFSCTVFDAEGQLIANAPHMPVHLGSMGESVAWVRRQHGVTLAAGDVFALNAPYRGGTHLPDITVVTPVFMEGAQPAFYVASRGHHADVGGKTPGSMPPDSSTVDEEGVLLDNVRIVHQGCFLAQEIRTLLTSGPYPARNPEQNLADLQAQIAANAQGARELAAMVQTFGLQVVQAYMTHVQANAEAAVRCVLKRGALPQSRQFAYEMDDGNVVHVAVHVDRTAGAAVVDLTGTSAQGAHNFNAPRAVCMAAVLYVFRLLVEEDIPLNAGCLKPIQVIIPEGCMLNPVYPAAVVAGNVETSQCVTDALLGALEVMAAAQGTMNNFTFGNAHQQYYETVCGGAGAGPHFPGASAVQTHMTNSRLTDPEVLEWRYPVRLESFAIRRGSGGAGRFAGGDGVVRRIRFLEPMTATILANRRRIPPFGLHGGGAGALGRTYVQRHDGRVDVLPSCASVSMGVGDVFVIETPGGGGFGACGVHK